MFSGLDNSIEPEWFRNRLNLVLIWIVIAFLILAGRLFWLQIINGEKYRELSLNNRIRIKRISPSRGFIYDRNGTILVDNRPSFNLNIVPKDAESIDDLVGELSRIVEIKKGLSKRLKKALINSPFKPVVVAKDIDRKAVAIIEASQFFLSGAYVSVEAKRNYLYPGAAAHIIGYLGEVDAKFLRKRKFIDVRTGDYTGKSGLEKKYEDSLRGKYGGEQVEVNARGKVMKILDRVAPVPGNNLVLTIDLELQKYAMELLGSEAGAVIAMEPYTGEILCMVSSPTFDENKFINGMSSDEWKSLMKNPARPMQNKATQGEYPPGSIYKMIPAIAGLEEGIVKKQEKLFCAGKYYYGDRFFRCWNFYGHGHIDLKDAIVNSCDVYFYRLGEKLGIKKLAKYSRLFGLGKKTGIEIENEEAGIVPDHEWKKKRFGTAWQGGETLSVVIGQGANLVTPLQMAVMTSAFANGGYLVRPVIVKEIIDSNGNLVDRNRKNIINDLKIKKENLQIVQKAMDAVVNTPAGTGYDIRSDIVRIAGKTGTAQVVSSKKYYKNKKSIKKQKKFLPHAWFAAYADSAKPEIAVVVLVEHGEHGSTSAGPIAKKIIEKFYQGKKS
ncbi:MAG: penicillin-binding protein 2 [Deltaproteobacteria bacterium]|nr:MAG: penicillin-binding protein 2 [Deltaproteobacteria bacterium]